MKTKKAILSKIIVISIAVLCIFYAVYTQEDRKEMKMIRNYVETYWDEILNTSTSLEKRDVNKLLNLFYNKNIGTEKEFYILDLLKSLCIENYKIKKIEKLTDGLYRAFIQLDGDNLYEHEKDQRTYVALINNQWRIIIGVYNIPEEYKKEVEEKGIILEDPKPDDGTIILDWDDYGVTWE